MKWLDTDVIKAFGGTDLVLFIYSSMQRKSKQGKIIRTGNEIMTVMNKV